MTTKSILVFAGLLLLTLITTTIAGMEWVNGNFILDPNPSEEIDWLSFSNISQGLTYSLSFLGILTFHEFGHYFTARHYGIKTTLPFYIPLWLGISLSFGTIGAFIRIKERITSRKEYFDVGIAGPLAGFVVGLVILIYGFTTLPPAEYLFTYNPHYEQYGENFQEYIYQDVDQPIFKVGKNLLFLILESTIVSDPSRIPNGYEMFHYPLIFSGFLAMFFTALNLLPIGQLDGGHVVFGLFGYRKARKISEALYFSFVFYAGLGWVTPFLPVDELSYMIPINIGLYYIMFLKMRSDWQDVLLMATSLFTLQFLSSYFFPEFQGYTGWLVFAFLIGRFLGVYHPPAIIDDELDTKRKVLGWIALLIFVLCFSPQPFTFELPSMP